MVVTISNPRLEGQNLTYDVKTLEGDLPKTGPIGLMLRDAHVHCRLLEMRKSSAATALPLRSTRNCAWIAVADAPHAAIRSSSQSSMKAENWFQLRVVGSPPSRSPASAGFLLSLSAAGQVDFICAYGGVAVADTDHANVCGRSSDPRTRKDLTVFDGSPKQRKAMASAAAERLVK